MRPSMARAPAPLAPGAGLADGSFAPPPTSEVSPGTATSSGASPGGTSTNSVDPADGEGCGWSLMLDVSAGASADVSGDRGGGADGGSRAGVPAWVAAVRSDGFRHRRYMAPAYLQLRALPPRFILALSCCHLWEVV